MSPRRALLIGYGNPGRGDDGLGPAFAERIAELSLPGLSVQVDYQLTADHALAISEHDLVIFADADVACENRFTFLELGGEAAENMGSHSVTPEAAVALSKLLFETAPPAFVLGIAGARFGEIEEGLSATALGNLDIAADFFVNWYESYQDSSA